MKGLILNSGMGSRMGDLTSDQPKCMTDIGNDETIISRQLKQLKQLGIKEVVITTGFFDKILIEYCQSLNLGLTYTFVNNPIYDSTNYIYSIYLAKEHLDDDLVFLHGDLVFETNILTEMMSNQSSYMTISSTLPLPKKDFKAVIKNDKISQIGIDFFNNSVAAQPLYKINKLDWKVWMNQIVLYCEADNVSCYAEKAFNDISDECLIYPFDYKDRLCSEIDTPSDLKIIKNALKEA